LKANFVNDSKSVPPGVVINQSPARLGIYIGSPSIAVLPNGEYVASHDYFRHTGSGKSLQNEMVVFGSDDQGATWQKRSELKGFWQNLFVHERNLYLMGLTKEYGHVIIRRSIDGGLTWTEPMDRTTGVLLDNMQYHTAPVPVCVHNGRIWRAMEAAENCAEWAKACSAFVMSARLDMDLLHADNWTITNRIRCDLSWLNGDFGGWLEGNVVVAADGSLVNILRVDLPQLPEKVAIMTINPTKMQADFDPKTGFIDFPGGAKKFSIRFDSQTNAYWALVNPCMAHGIDLEPIAIRNTLALSRSKDLRAWQVRAILLEHPDVYRHAFQYADWLFDGDDIIAVVRTAYDDNEGGANSAHNANYLTFHRFRNFRKLS